MNARLILTSRLRSSVMTLSLAAAIALSGCGTVTGSTLLTTTTAAAVPADSRAVVAAPASGTDTATIATPVATATVAYESDDLAMQSSAGEVPISLDNDGIIAGVGVTVDGNTVMITDAGTYRLMGRLSDGQIVVDTADQETVRLILDGVEVANASGSSLYVINAEKLVLELERGTESTFSDTESYTAQAAESDETDAAIFSTTDLTITGEGTLNVYGNYRHGIVSKDNLKITGGTLVVQARSDGLRGRDYVAIRAGVVSITAGSDGIQANNDEDAEKGYVSIEGGTVTVIAGADGIQAETTVSVSGGDVRVTAGGGSEQVAFAAARGGAGWGPGASSNATSEEDAVSMKAIKAGIAIVISGGVLVVDAADDSFHANGTIQVSGGALSLASGDDAIRADQMVSITGGDIAVTKCYEGIESAAIALDGGTIRLISSDDGVNIVRVAGSAAGQGLTIAGGYLAVDAGGDGFDVNGSITMSGGVVLIQGPINDGNGALDYDRGFQITGGLLVATGSAGMAMAPDTTSTQYSVLVNLSATQAAGTPVHITLGDGSSLVTFVPGKEYRSMVVSAPEMQQGDTVTIYAGGSTDGLVVDGLVTDGSYAAGSQIANLTLNSVVTGSGSGGGMMPGGRGRPRP